MRLTAAVKKAPCKEPIGDWLGYCLEDKNLKVRATSQEQAWELIEELIADVQSGDAQAERILKEFNDQWSVRIK